jgi:hypothetical protein
MAEIVLPDAPSSWAECTPQAAAVLLEDALAHLALSMMRDQDRESRILCAVSWAKIEMMIRERWQASYEAALFYGQGRPLS